MLIDKKVEINVKSSMVISKLKAVGISSKIGDKIIIDINQLWTGSNIEVNVKCDICSNEKKLQYNLYNKNKKKHNIYTCSNKCAHVKNKLTCLGKYGYENYQNVEKIKQTKLERYGDENYNNIEKIKKTNLERYGVEYSILNEEVIKKIKKTNLERYGNEDFRKSDSIKEKRKDTFIRKYGNDNYMKCDNFRYKAKITNMNNYGVEYYSKTKDWNKKIKKTNLERYGYISNSMSDECKNKLKNTNKERYGVEYPMQCLEFLEKQQKNSKKIIKYNEKLYYQGNYEKHFLDYLSEINIIDKVERGPIIKYFFENKEKIYFPDFYIDEYNLIIEVKSSYYYNKYYEKNILKMKKCINDGYNFLFVIDKNYNNLNYIIKNPL